jgi:hypothetical protein
MFPIPLHEYVSGDSFEACCDLKYMLGMDEQAFVNEPHTIFCPTHCLRSLLDILAQTKHRYVVVSHNSDGNILPGESRRAYDFCWENIPLQLYHLFAQNCDVSDTRITPIPIGFENAMYFPKERKRAKIHALASLGVAKPKNVLVCHSAWTNPVTRIPPYIELHGNPNVTFMDGRNGIDYDEYLFQLAQHKFIISPDGNGIDCVRNWEALTLGTIPITQRHVCTEAFSAQLSVDLCRGGGCWESAASDESLNRWAQSLHRPIVYDIMTASYWQKEIAEKFIESQAQPC